jgi:hypothetical protein
LFFVLAVLVFELPPFFHHQSFLNVRYFRGKVSELFAWDWLQIMILLISASRVTRITGMSHWHWADTFFFKAIRMHGAGYQIDQSAINLAAVAAYNNPVLTFVSDPFAKFFSIKLF